MDHIITMGSEFACKLLEVVEASSLRVSLCYNTDGNRYATGIAFGSSVHSLSPPPLRHIAEQTKRSKLWQFLVTLLPNIYRT